MRISTPCTSDETLWYSFLDGDKEAYADIYKKYFALLYDYGMRYSKNSELVKDCIQDLFVKLWTNRKNFQSTITIKPYLYAALRTTMLNKMEQACRMAARSDRTMAMNTFDLHYSTAEETLIHEDEEMIRKEKITAALNNLTSRQKESIFLRFYIGLEYPEIAEMMGISVKASYKIIGRAIAVMRKYFEQAVIYGWILFFLAGILL